MTTDRSSAGSNDPLATPVPGDSPRRVRSDLRFIRWYAHTVPHVIRRYRDDAIACDPLWSPEELLTSIEVEVAAECRRMRIMFRAILAVVLMPILLGGFLWSGLYWLPVTVLWLPFERGVYGLPWFSLFEWLAFLMLATFLAGSLAVIVEGFASTRRVSTDYRRLEDAPAEERSEIADAARSGNFPRGEYLLGHAKPFAAYAALLAGDLTDARVDAETAS